MDERMKQAIYQAMQQMQPQLGAPQGAFARVPMLEESEAMPPMPELRGPLMAPTEPFDANKAYGGRRAPRSPAVA